MAQKFIIQMPKLNLKFERENGVNLNHALILTLSFFFLQNVWQDCALLMSLFLLLLLMHLFVVAIIYRLIQFFCKLKIDSSLEYFVVYRMYVLFKMLKLKCTVVIHEIIHVLLNGIHQNLELLQV